MKLLRIVCGLLLGVLFAASLNSLTSFPTTFDDEGFYALSARNYVEKGQFAFWSGDRPAPFEKGDALRSRINPLAFAALSKVAEPSLHTARLIPFAWIWISVALWFFISLSLGVPGELGALLFAATEKIFYASHVFRPEAPLVLFTTILIFMMTRAARPVARGLLNAGFVLSHGDGIVAAIINSLDLLKRKKPRLFALYVVGSCGAIVVFYLVQVLDTGGWQIFFGQLHASSQYHPHGGVLGILRHDLEARWAFELIKVGTSVFAKFLRVFFYLVVFSTAIYSVFRLKGPARTFGAYALVCFAGFVFLVHDKCDIQISEMDPFLIASFLGWVGTKAIRPRLRFGGFLAVLGVCLALTFHHAIRHSGQTSYEREMAILDQFLDSPKQAGRYRTVVGEGHFWFHLNRRDIRFVYWRDAEFLPPLQGGIVFIGSPGDILKGRDCKVDYIDPDSIFTAVYCSK